MTKFGLVFLILTLCRITLGQVGTFDWRMHVSYTNPSGIASNGKDILCAFNNGILHYDLDNHETELWSKTNYLSDIQITCVYYAPQSQTYWVGYANGNIDKIQGNTISNIPYLKLANISSSKKINNFFEKDGQVYVIADFGILVINPIKDEISETYYTNNIGEFNLNIAFLNDSIFALTSHGVYKAAASSIQLADYTQWKLISSTALQPDSAHYSGMVVWNNQIVLAKNKQKYFDDSLYFLHDDTLSQPINNIFEFGNGSIFVIDNDLYVCNTYTFVIYDYSTFTIKEQIYHYPSGKTVNPKALIKASDGSYYLADNERGLVHYINYDNSTIISPQGPPSDQFFKVQSQKDKLMFSGGIITGGPKYFYPRAYSFQKEVWTDFSKSASQPLIDTMTIFDMNAVAINPKDENNIAIGANSANQILFISKDGKNLTESYGKTNSILDSALNNSDMYLITDLKYDNKGNLWILNSLSSYPLKVLTKDGIFYKFNTGSSTSKKVVNSLVIDGDGNPWFAVDGVGIVGYFYNGTIDDASDDSYKILNSGDFTGALPNNNVTDIVKTSDDKLFITTTQGFSILNSPSSVKDAAYGNYNTYRPKIEFGENTEYVLGYTNITCAAIDGGNRKWVGTDNSGIFCLSADGYSIAEQYNTDNSKLISNRIIDMTFDETNGELFVITDLGLESLRTDASTGTDNYDNTIVFPNPVQPSFRGVVTIQGIKENSDVKVTDVAGNLVYQTTSNGGTATWNIKKVNGDDVATGVYLIWTAPKEGKGRKVGQVTVIR